MANHVEQAIAGLKKSEEEYINHGISTIPELATEFVESTTTRSKECVKSFKELMKHYVQMDNDVKAYVKSVDKVYNLIASSSIETGDIASNLDDIYAHEQEKGSVTTSEAYRKLERILADGGDEATVEEEMGEEEFIIQGETLSMKCPYTGKEMVEPVKNTNCGHSYDREGILTYIRQRRKQARCPFSGCKNQAYITEKCLVTDSKLKKAIEKKNRKERK